MKLNTSITNTSLIAFVILSFITGCKKTDIHPDTNTVNISENDEVSISKEGNNTKLTLRPGAKTSQDVYVGQWDGNDEGNENGVDELSVVAWTDQQLPFNCSAYIRFDSLAKIPINSAVVSAKLYLYTPSTSRSTPQGNSDNDNMCYIRRVLNSWSESTMSFNNQPADTSAGEAILSASQSQWNDTAVVDVTTMVMYFVKHPRKNFGFHILLENQATYRSRIFGSSEQPDKQYRPKLVINYQ